MRASGFRIRLILAIIACLVALAAVAGTLIAETPAAANRVMAIAAITLILACLVAIAITWIATAYFTRHLLAPDAALVERERRLRAVLERGADDIVLVDRAGTLLYTTATRQAFGYRLDELIGHSSLEFVHEDDRGRLRSMLADISRTAGRTGHATFRVLAKSGEWRWVRAELSNMLHEPQVGAFVGKYRDVTEARLQRQRASDHLQRRVEEGTAALYAANERLTRLSRAIEQTADSVFITDRNGTIEYVNPAFEQMTGYSSGEAIGNTPRLVSSGHHDRRFYANLCETILAGKVFRAVVTNKRKDGGLFSEDQSITPIRDADGAITHFVSTGRDITERKRTEAALRRLNAALEGEAARIASVLHDEAGQFLSAAHITLAGISRDLATDQQARIQQVRHHLDLAEQQLRRVSHELHPRMLEDLGLVEAVRFLANGFVRRTGISVDVDISIASSCPRPVETVFYRLVQEGLANIGKHAGATHVFVSLGGDEARFLCSIRDDGVGFDVERAIAERRSFSLGLALMRDRVEAVGGTLTIVSSPQRGTELRASVPVEA